MHLISRALEVASEVLADRSLPMPAHLRCVSDKASGETKHFLFMDVLVGGSPPNLDRYVVPRPCWTHTAEETESLLPWPAACGGVRSYKTRAILLLASTRL